MALRSWEGGREGGRGRERGGREGGRERGGKEEEGERERREGREIIYVYVNMLAVWYNQLLSPLSPNALHS